MTDYFPTSETTGAGDLLDMNAGDSVYVAPQVVLTDTNGANFGIKDLSSGFAEIFGSVTANDAVFFAGAADQTSDIQIGQTGLVTDYGFGGVGIEVETGPYDISNSGQIIADDEGTGIDVGGGGAIRNYGTIDATTGINNFDSSGADVAYLDNYGTIGASATAISDTGGHAAYVNNYGSIVVGGVGGGSAVFADAATFEDLNNVGSITGGVTLLSNNSRVDNQGTIIGGLVSGAIDLEGANASLTNSGTLDGDVSLGGANDSAVNTGVINGDVGFFGGTNTFFDSRHGSVSGEIDTGDGGATVYAGVTGGTVIGGLGNDKLYASPTLAAADNGAETTLDGAGGDNWLVGDGGFVTFDSGDGNGGVNHINGRLSKMSDVAGDANNTVSYAALSGPYQSVSVDLLTGHAWMSSTANANTAPQADLTFEDYLRNVSNVIGSSGADAIFCDNGVDNITAGGAGTMMTAGVGAHSQDTFVFTSFAASTAADEDVITGFKAGVDMLDFSALNVTAANIKITQASNHHFNTVIVEETPGVSNPATNLTLSVHATTATLLTTGSIIF